MVQKELPQAWWFDSHNRAKPSRWLNSTLSELDEKTKQMLNVIEQDADSFAQRAEMYYKKRPILVDMLGDLYRTHRSLAEQYDLLKHGSGTRHTVFGLSSCTQSRSHQAPPMNGGKATSPVSSCTVSTYDSESEVDDPEQEEEHEEEEEEVSGTETESSKEEEEQQGQVELMRAEIERLKEQNAALRNVAAENAALKAELAGKDEEKREVIRQLASSFDMMREENCTLRGRIRGSKNSPSRATFDLKKVTRDLFSARLLFPARCRPNGGPIVAI